MLRESPQSAPSWLLFAILLSRRLTLANKNNLTCEGPPPALLAVGNEEKYDLKSDVADILPVQPACLSSRHSLFRLARNTRTEGSDSVSLSELSLIDHTDSSGLQADGLFGYRRGDCDRCNCCPACWSCAELLAYDCPEKNGLQVETIEAPHLELKIGDEAGQMWTTVASLQEWKSLPTAGWAQCASLPSLPAGLLWSDAMKFVGKVSGPPLALGYSAVDENGNVFEKHGKVKVRFTAFSVVGWEETGRVVKLVIPITIGASDDASKLESQSRAGKKLTGANIVARQQELLGRTYSSWQRWQLENMDAGFRELDALFRENPFAHRGNDVPPGMMLAHRAGLGMNAHKYMRNVHPETEFLLGQALLFPDKGVRQSAAENLPGCWQKRQLESARYLLLAGCKAFRAALEAWQAAQRVPTEKYGDEGFKKRTELCDSVTDHLRVARSLLERSSTAKDGYGWAVNNGDMWVVLGFLDLMEVLRPIVADPQQAFDRKAFFATFEKIAGDSANGIWQQALQKVDKGRQHPFQKAIDEGKRLMHSVRVGMEQLGSDTPFFFRVPEAAQIAANEIVQQLIPEMVLEVERHFKFPNRATTRQHYDAYTVASWIPQLSAHERNDGQLRNLFNLTTGALPRSDEL